MTEPDRSAAALLARFDLQMRADPPPAPGVQHERIGKLVRTTGAWNLVQALDLSDAEAPAAVAEQAAFARAHGIELEWKLFDHDGPAALRKLLHDAGFVPDESETFMVLVLEGSAAAAPGSPDADVRRVIDADGVRDYIDVSSAAFGPGHAHDAQTYLAMLRDPRVVLFVAYADGAPVSAGRLQMPEGRCFASNWGGATVPHHRHRGMYRAVVTRRAAEARARGYRYLTVDARESSRPILERVGFVGLDGVTGWVLRPPP